LEEREMAEPMVLYSGPLSMFGMKAEIALREKDISFKRIEVVYNTVDGYWPKHPEVLRINPKQQVPVLIDGDVEIFDSTQIFEYLEDIAPTPPLWPANVRARARARLLEHLSDEVYFPHVVKLMGLQNDLASPAALAAIAAIDAYCRDLERGSSGQGYLTASYSYADIAFFMAQLFAERMGAPLSASTPKLIAWRKSMSERAAARPVIARLVDYLSNNKRFVPAFLQAAASAKSQ
jgi:glutathione S-transferase